MYLTPHRPEHHPAMNGAPPQVPGREVDLAYQQLYRTVTDLRSMVGRYKEKAQALTDAHHTSLVRLAQAVELKEGEHGTHLVRVGQLAARLGHYAGLDADACELLCRAAPLHDIGKIGVPDEVLNKPGPLREVEWQIVRLHPEIGARLLFREDAEIFQQAAEIALRHHEKWDGSGYPDGLAGKAIPLWGRIVGLIDAFDSLTMNRPYRSALPDETALGIIADEAGKAFDPQLTAIFLMRQTEFLQLRDALNQRYRHVHELDLTPADFKPVPFTL